INSGLGQYVETGNIHHLTCFHADTEDEDYAYVIGVSQLLARIRQPTYLLALLVVIIGAGTRHFARVEPYEEGVGCQM
ncbi:MAG: hypothetical protein HKN42_17345, partial [Granulosicoccus sp.]|nr:hypothetical protein [Granulosicoccus sp.]